MQLLAGRNARLALSGSKKGAGGCNLLLHVLLLRHGAQEQHEHRLSLNYTHPRRRGERRGAVDGLLEMAEKQDEVLLVLPSEVQAHNDARCLERRGRLLFEESECVEGRCEEQPQPTHASPRARACPRRGGPGSRLLGGVLGQSSTDAARMWCLLARWSSIALMLVSACA